MYKFKIYIILILFLLLIILYFYNKEYFTLQDTDIFVDNTAIYGGKKILLKLHYRNDCQKVREFMYGCCSRETKQYNTKNKFLGSNESHTGDHQKKYEKEIATTMGNNIFMGSLNPSPSSSTIINITNTNPSNKEKCLDYKQFITADFYNICHIEGTKTNFEKLKDYLNLLKDNTDNFVFEFIKSKDSVPSLEFYEINSTTNNPVYKPSIYKGDINNLCNLTYWINQELVNLVEDSTKDDSAKDTKKQKLKEIRDRFLKNIVCIPGNIYIVSQNENEKNDLIENSKINGNFIDSRPKLILSDLLYHNDYRYTLILIEHKYLQENYGLPEDNNLLYWAFWGVDLKDDKMVDDNNKNIVNGYIINELFKGDNDISRVIHHKDNYEIYPYLLFNNNDLQLDNIGLVTDYKDKKEIQHAPCPTQTVITQKEITEPCPSPADCCPSDSSPCFTPAVETIIECDPIKINMIKDTESYINLLRNNFNGVNKNVDIRLKLHLLKEEQYNYLTNIYKDYYRNKHYSLFYNKFFNYLGEIKDDNDYQEKTKEENIKYNISNENDIKRLEKYNNLQDDEKQLLFRLYTYPHQYISLKCNTSHNIKIIDEGYYELVLLNEECSYINNSPCPSSSPCSSDETAHIITYKGKEYYLNDDNNILYLPGKLILNSNLELVCNKTSSYVLRKSKYIIQDINLNNTIKLSKKTSYDIVIYKDTNTKDNYEESNNMYTYKVDDKNIIVIRKKDKKDINLNPIEKKVLLTKKSYYIIFHTDEESEINYKVKNTDTFKSLYDNKPEFRHKLIKDNYLYSSPSPSESTLIKKDTNTLIELNTKKGFIKSKTITFKTSGPEYRLSKDDINNLGKRRINNVKIENYYDINKIVPTLRVELYKLLENVDTTGNEKLSPLKRNDEILKTIHSNEHKGVIKIYLGTNREDIKDENLLYVKWDIDLYEHNNITNYIEINDTNDKNTIYNLNILGKKYENIYLIMTFSVYKKYNLTEEDSNNILKFLNKDRDNNIKYIEKIESVIVSPTISACPVDSVMEKCSYNNILNEFSKIKDDIKIESKNKLNDNLLYVINKHIKKENIIEYSNYSSYGPLQLKQNECRLTYNNYKRNYKREDKFDKYNFNAPIHSNTFTSIQRKYGPSISGPRIRVDEEDLGPIMTLEKDKPKTLTQEESIQASIEKYKNEIFNVFGID